MTTDYLSLFWRVIVIECMQIINRYDKLNTHLSVLNTLHLNHLLNELINSAHNGKLDNITEHLEPLCYDRRIMIIKLAVICGTFSNDEVCISSVICVDPAGERYISISICISFLSLLYLCRLRWSHILRGESGPQEDQEGGGLSQARHGQTDLPRLCWRL